MELARTPLYSKHLELSAKLADFGGWEMPIEYAGTLHEHNAVRTHVGMFDVSHMGKLRIRGYQAQQWLATQLASNILSLQPGQAQYSMLLNDEAGIVDDLIVYFLTATEIWIVPNASNASKVHSILERNLIAGVTLENLHFEYGIIAVQGPNADSALAALNLNAQLEYMQVRFLSEIDDAAVLCRTGYTGEYGFELIVPNKYLVDIWQKLLNANVVPAGLGARDTLRLEMGYPLHGHELSESITPVSAGLAWAIDWDQQFIGSVALSANRSNPTQYRVAIEFIDRGIPRAEMPIYFEESEIGFTTSGTFSPSKKVGIGLGLINRKLPIGTEVEVDVRGRKLKAMVVKLPFWPSHVK